MNKRYVLPLVLFGLMLFLFRDQRIDEEAYIILRYARNIADGYGYVWNIGESPLWGSTSLLWTILLGLSSAITGVSLTILTPLFGIGIAIAIIVTVCHAAPNDLSATILGSFVAVSMMVGHALVGLDVLIFTLLLLLTYLNKNNNHRLVILGVFLSVARPEGLVLAGAFVLVHYYENRNIRVPILFTVMGGIIFLSIWMYFGEFIPNPLYVKTIAGEELSLFVGNLRFLLSYFTRMESLLPLTLVMSYLVSRATKKEIQKVVLGALPIIVYCGIYLFIHQTQNVLGRFQYPVVPVFYVICITGIGGLFIMPKTRTHMLILICLFGLLLATEYNSTATVLNRNVEDTNKTAVGLALSEFSDLTLATTDAGIVPYYSQWRTICILGLSDRTLAREGFNTDYLDSLDIHLFMTHSRTSNWSVRSTDPIFDALNEIWRYFIETRNFSLVCVVPYSSHSGVLNYYAVAPSFTQRDSVIQALCEIDNLEYAWRVE